MQQVHILIITYSELHYFKKMESDAKCNTLDLLASPTRQLRFRFKSPPSAGLRGSPGNSAGANIKPVQGTRVSRFASEFRGAFLVATKAPNSRPHVISRLSVISDIFVRRFGVRDN